MASMDDYITEHGKEREVYLLGRAKEFGLEKYNPTMDYSGSLLLTKEGVCSLSIDDISDSDMAGWTVQNDVAEDVDEVSWEETDIADRLESISRMYKALTKVTDDFTFIKGIIMLATEMALML